MGRARNHSVAAYNARQNRLKADADAVAEYYDKLRAGKPVRSSGHKFGGARGQRADDYYFPSQAERRRYLDLKLMQQAKLITDLTVHPSWQIEINGVKICRVVEDFSYHSVELDKLVVEDVKRERAARDGAVKFTTNTTISKIKQRLLLAAHGIEVTVVK